MNDNVAQNIIEREYRFLIDRDKLTLEPPRSVGGFNITKTKGIHFKDYLFEREIKSLKDENIGFRVRDFLDGKIEFTYKKFLGREEGMARYDEFTTDLTKEEADKLLNDDFDISRLPILAEMLKQGKLYYYLTIENSRKVYDYELEDSSVELVLEDITFSNAEKSVKDATMEIEIKTEETMINKISLLVEAIKTMYQCADQNEGKNTRAIKLLGINLK